MRRAAEGALDDEAEADEDEEAVEAGQLSLERYAEMSAPEDLILTITTGGAGQARRRATTTRCAVAAARG